jgi:hypothetical protein
MSYKYDIIVSKETADILTGKVKLVIPSYREQFEQLIKRCNERVLNGMIPKKGNVN